MAKKNKSTVPKTDAQVEQPLSQINPSLERLGVPVGDWSIEFSNLSYLPDPSAVAHGYASFEWLEDGNTIKAQWEKSSDDSHWEHDFDLTYTRVKRA